MNSNSDDLFMSNGVDEIGLPKANSSTPLAVRMRPKKIEDIVGQDAATAAKGPLARLVTPNQPTSSVIIWGPPGTGKTTIAYIVATSSGREFTEISAVTAGVKEIRDAIAQARRHLAIGKETVLFIDEVHRFSKSQQDALLPAVENGWVTMIAATTENPAFSVISPLLSRSLLVTLSSLDEISLSTLIDRALNNEFGLPGVRIEDAARADLIRLAGGDGRRVLTLLEAAAAAANMQVITPVEVALSADTAVSRYDQDQHYDVISAFIKSMRGSDPDAAIHYLARMIDAGEDPRFIARRIIICASEDVGLADSSALQIAVAAAEAVEKIGMPEGRIPLAHAAIAVACAPKSNAAYLAIDRALADIRKGLGRTVPAHLRDAHYSYAKKLGAGQEYLYAHDYPHGVAPQQYLPEDIATAKYYEPTGNGAETLLQSRLAKITQLRTMR